MTAKPKVTEKESPIGTEPSHFGMPEQRDERLLYLTSLIGNISDALIATDMDFNILEWNAAAEKMYGWTAAEVMGQPIQKFIRSEYRDANTDQGAVQALQEQGLWKGEVTQQRKDGASIALLASVSMVKDKTGKPIGFVAINRDITEHKQAEGTLQRLQERFAIAFQSSPAGLAISSLEDGLFIEVNESYLRLIEYQRDEVIGHTSTELNLISASERARYIQQFREQGRLINFEMQLQAKSGRLVHMLFSSQPIELNGVACLLSTMIDITERKHAEKQIQHQLNRLNALRSIDTAISSSFDIRVTLNIVLRQVLAQLGVDAAAILLLNPENQSIEYVASRGFRSGTLDEQTPLKPGGGHASRAMREHRTIHSQDLSEAPQVAQDDFVDYFGTPLIVKGEAKGVLEIYHRVLLHSNTDWLDFLETLAGQAAIAIDNAQLFDSLQRANSALEQRVHERTTELKHLNLELEHANRAKDEFLATMSHELRTPLNSILGLSESLLEQRREPLSARQQKSLQTIAASGHHLLELINDILDLSKIEAGRLEYHPQIVMVEDLCQSSLAFVKEQANRKSVTLTYEGTLTVPQIYSDPRRLKQALINLLNNAVKFTSDHGQVSLQVRVDAELDRIQFSVIDNGIGIALQDMQQLFVPFVQVDSSLTREHEGTGLGLALVQKLIDRLGGSIDVESERGKGSRFTINLPMQQEMVVKKEASESGSKPLTSAQTEKSDAAAHAPVEGGIILLAEDNMANILTIGDYLESHGYQVVVAHNGLEAIEKAGEIQPNIILMDIQMPMLNGMEAISRLRADSRFESTPIIALTALAMPGDRERCLEAGANEYMSKPVSLKALIEKIRELLNQKP